jgi:Tfp pilus assembly protein PilV
MLPTRSNSVQAPNGFIVLEALIAMSLILGVWMTAVDTYHALVLNIAHHERKRAELLEAFD